MTEMLTNTQQILIAWGDCDPAGIVFYPRYFAWFDAATAALFAAAGLPILPALFHPDRWLLWLGVLFVLIVYFFPSGIVGKLREVSRR